MKNLILAFILLYATSSIYSQAEQKDLNFDFETVEDGVPIGWQHAGDGFNLVSDSEIQKSGNYSISIESTAENPNFAAWSFKLPHNYDGKRITLSGYIKTENVEDGFAGLWMRIDPGIDFSNMRKTNLKGTSDWTKYEITLEMNPEKTDQIIIGGLLSGKGKVWFDDFEVSIDNKDIKNLKPFQRKLYPADSDKEFDEGSGISTISVDENQIQNLKTLGMVWGFLKYHHPNIAKGNYNWDYELFRILPKYLVVENNAKRDELLLQWVDELGEFSKGKKVKIKSSKVKIVPDLDWIENSDFSAELVTKLLEVKTAKRSDEHYYIGLQPSVENPDFKNENSYASMTYPDAGFRLLSLYRYWNIIQYYFPYKNLIEEDWKGVLEEFLPAFIESENKKEYTFSCLELIGRVHDTHANIWGNNKVINDHWGINYAASEVTFIENKAVVTSYHDEGFGRESGLEFGDVITKIGGKSLDEIVKERLKYTPASSYPIKLRNIARNLLRTNEGEIDIEFVRHGQPEQMTIIAYTTDEIDIYGRYEDVDTCFKLINKNIAYINNGSLQNKYLPEIWGDIENTTGLIIDIRNYPSDFPIYELSNYLMPKTTPFVKFGKGSVENPGYFLFTKPLSVGEKNKNYYDGKVIILTNETSQSSAEFHAMAYRVHPNATVIGSTTAGADGNISRFYLPGNIATLISGIGVYYPDGEETQRVGIVPDIELKPTIQGIKESRDELLEKAVQIIMDSRIIEKK